jgi:hypothetical protein
MFPLAGIGVTAWFVSSSKQADPHFAGSKRLPSDIAGNVVLREIPRFLFFGNSFTDLAGAYRKNRLWGAAAFNRSPRNGPMNRSDVARPSRLRGQAGCLRYLSKTNPVREPAKHAKHAKGRKLSAHQRS